MNQPFVWISNDLVCERSQWSYLIHQGIKPLVDRFIAANSVASFRIKLNTVGEESIRLSLFVAEQQAEALASQAESYFTYFFSTLHAVAASTEEAIPAFPDTPIRFKHDEGVVDPSPASQHQRDFQQACSRLLMEIAAENALDEETLIIGAFQMQIGWVKALSQVYTGNLDGLLKLHAYESYHKKDEAIDSEFISTVGLLELYENQFTNGKNELTDLELANILFNDNQALLQETTQAILNSPAANALNAPWVEQWVENCEHFIRQYATPGTEESKPLSAPHHHVLQLLDEQLGITEETKLLLFYFLKGTFSIRFHTYQPNNAPELYWSIEKFFHHNNVAKTRNRFTKLDSQEIPEGKEETRLFVVARNESLRIDYFLKYYLSRGVDRIFLIDNNSTDHTREIALGYQNVHVFQINERYKDHWYWMEYFLHTYGQDRWSIVVDIDELLFYPGGENLSLKDVVQYLEAHHFTAVKSLLLDMYSDKAISDTNYVSGTDPLLASPFFDPNFEVINGEFQNKKNWRPFKDTSYSGGMRSRVFGQDGDKQYSFCLTKISLFKYADPVYLIQGMHAITGAKLADIGGVVFHTKFLQDFVHEVREEVQREEHFLGAYEYKLYNEHITSPKKMTLAYENSVRFKNADQLVALGLMKSSPQFERFVAQHLLASAISTLAEPCAYE